MRIPLFTVRNSAEGVHTDKALSLNTISAMTENEIMTRDIHYFVRGKMNFEEGLKLIQKVCESEEWIDHLLFDIYLYEKAVNQNRRKLNDELDLNGAGIEFSSNL